MSKEQERKRLQGLINHQQGEIADLEEQLARAQDELHDLGEELERLDGED